MRHFGNHLPPCTCKGYGVLAVRERVAEDDFEDFSGIKEGLVSQTREVTSVVRSVVLVVYVMIVHRGKKANERSEAGLKVVH